ncbi:MAG: phosphatidylglycerol lysyltransferase domain-containing protein [Muribaculaceae bacterium]|nr:phosphatidylglycerol lysyltransferase domain-containing protein [Muribaculaceae bacterium]
MNTFNCIFPQIIPGDDLEIYDLPDIDFRPVTDADISLLEYYFKAYPARSCDFTIGGVLIWAEYYNYQIAVIKDTLIIKGTLPDSDTSIFYAPIGAMDSEEYCEIIRNYCRIKGMHGYILEPTEIEPSDTGDGRPTQQGIIQGMTEYLYNIEKFINFPGKKMEKKRNHLNFFNREYNDIEIEEINQSLSSQMISFTIAFGATHDDEVADYEARNIIDSIRSYDKYPYYGIVLKQNGKVIGYTFGEAIGDTFVIHAEKGDIQYRGIYQALASKLAEAVKLKYPDIKYLNREDDMGFEHLRKSKLSYHPSLYIAKRLVKVP